MAFGSEGMALRSEGLVHRADRLPVGFGLRGAVKVEVMRQQFTPFAPFIQSQPGARHDKPENEINECLHTLNLGDQAAQFKNGDARC